jgi:hypothetical protein
MRGTSAGMNFDRLAINGNATLKGTLTVTNSGTIPEGSYTILTTTGTRSGKFKTEDLPAGYTVTYKSNAVIINVPADLANSKQEENVQQGAVKPGEISILPNPAKQIITINLLSQAKKGTIEIFDANGKRVYTNVFEPNSKKSIDISKLAAGTYYVTLNDGNKLQSVKFIKQ